MFKINILANSILEKKPAVKKRRILVHPSTMFRNYRQLQLTELNRIYNHINQETAMRSITAGRHQQQTRSVTITCGIWLHDQYLGTVAASNLLGGNATKNQLQRIYTAIAFTKRV